MVKKIGAVAAAIIGAGVTYWAASTNKLDYKGKYLGLFQEDPGNHSPDDYAKGTTVILGAAIVGGLAHWLLPSFAGKPVAAPPKAA